LQTEHTVLKNEKPENLNLPKTTHLSRTVHEFAKRTYDFADKNS